MHPQWNGNDIKQNKKKRAHNHPVSPTSVVMLNIYWWNGISYRNWMTKKHTHTTLETGKLVSSSKVELKVVEMEYLLQNNSSRRTDKKNTPKTTRKNTPKTTRERRRWRTKREQKKNKCEKCYKEKPFLVWMNWNKYKRQRGFIHRQLKYEKDEQIEKRH